MGVRADPSVQGDTTLEIADSKEAKEHIATVFPIHLKAVHRGILSALSSGPLVSFPVRKGHKSIYRST